MKTNDERNKDSKNAKEALEYKQHAKTRYLCLQNSEDLITAAKRLTNSNLQHIQFHLAALALEDIGKAELIEMSFVAGLNSRDTTYEETSIENHVRKLYMAFWGPTFGKKIITKQELEQLQGLAKTYQKRWFSETALADLLTWKSISCRTVGTGQRLGRSSNSRSFALLCRSPAAEHVGATSVARILLSPHHLSSVAGDAPKSRLEFGGPTPAHPCCAVEPVV